jgi:malonate transporter MadL subunit
LLGQALGVKTNVGGVGIAMLLLIFARIYMAKKDILPKHRARRRILGRHVHPVVDCDGGAARRGRCAPWRAGCVAVGGWRGSPVRCVIAFINRTERPAVADEPAPVLHNELLTETESSP